jgi:hypothetical protein
MKKQTKLAVILFFVLALLSSLSSNGQKLGDTYETVLNELKAQGKTTLINDYDSYKIIYVDSESEIIFNYKIVDNYCRMVTISSASESVILEYFKVITFNKDLTGKNTTFIEKNNKEYGSIYYKLDRQDISESNEGETYYKLSIW